MISTPQRSQSEAATETPPSAGTGTKLSDETEDDSVIEKRLSVGILVIKFCCVNCVYKSEMMQQGNNNEKI
jgi:hypothetical protein